MDAIKNCVISIVVAFVIFNVIFLQHEISPIEGYGKLFSYAFVIGLSLTMYGSIFLIIVTLVFIVQQRAAIWNMGMMGKFARRYKIVFGELGAH